MKISAAMAMWICVAFGLVCLGFAYQGFAALESLTDAAERELSLGYAWFWTFLFAVAAVFGVLTWMIKAGKVAQMDQRAARKLVQDRPVARRVQKMGILQLRRFIRYAGAICSRISASSCIRAVMCSTLHSLACQDELRRGLGHGHLPLQLPRTSQLKYRLSIGKH